MSITRFRQLVFVCPIEQRGSSAANYTPQMPTLPTSPTGLYWSMRGHVICGEHAAKLIDRADEWAAEGWEPLRTSTQRILGIKYLCEKCGADHEVAVRSQNPSRPSHAH